MSNYKPSSEKIGPSLPPGFQDQSSTGDPLSRSTVPFGPTLPPGPTTSSDTGAGLSSNSEMLGTQIGSVGPTPRCNVHGPALPPGYTPADSPQDRIEEDQYVEVSPPPLDHNEAEDTDVIGPLPLAQGSKAVESKDMIRKNIESRSKTMKDKLTGKDKQANQKPQREDWMLVLPKEFKPSGIGPRKFRTGVIDSGDRSVWTDTPADRLKKKQESNEQKNSAKAVDDIPSQPARDEKLEKYVSEYNKSHRSESLISLHRKRRAEELKEQSGVKERKPFNRETDLEIRSTVSPAKRKALMKDSKQSLDSKFTHGSRSFL